MNVATYKLAAGTSLPKKVACVLERLLFSTAMLFLLVSVFVYRSSWMPLLFSPIEHIQLQGEFIYIDRLEVEQLVRSSLGDHFFDTDLKILKRSLESMAWVKRAHVMRQWPRTLAVKIEEHTAVARWGRDALLSSEGVVFVPTEINVNGLPTLYASQGMELTALARYHRTRTWFGADNGVALASLSEDRRGAWNLRLDNGLLIKVGDAHWESRLTRFVSAWREGLHKQAERIRCVDLRYANGFAVAWKDKQEECR